LAERVVSENEDGPDIRLCFDGFLEEVGPFNESLAPLPSIPDAMKPGRIHHNLTAVIANRLHGYSVLAASTSWLKAPGSLTAISASILRSTTISAALRPAINWE